MNSFDNDFWEILDDLVNEKEQHIPDIQILFIRLIMDI